jgi:hypothetical protein
MTRPLSLTIVAWVIIAMSIEGLVNLVAALIFPITSVTFHTDMSLSATDALNQPPAGPRLAILN